MTEPAPILHLSSSQAYGGAEEHIRTLVTHMDARRYRCAVALPAGGQFEGILGAQGIPTHRADFSGKWDLATLAALKRTVRETGYRIVHSHNRREDLAAALVSRSTGVPAVTTIHDRINMDQNGHRVRNLNARIYNRILRRRFKRVVTVSENTRRDVIAEARVDPSKVVHVTNGVDLARFDAAIPVSDARKRLSLAQDAIIVGIIARVRGANIGKKGHRLLFDAFAAVGPQFKGAVVAVAGEDESARSFLTGLAAQAGIVDRVAFCGYRTDVVQVICAFDVVVVPSLFEGLPRSLLDAMALGKCAVASSVDGIVEVVEDGVTGLLVPAADTHALSRALEKALGDGALRERLGQAAKDLVLRRYTASIMAEETAAVYDDLLGSRTKGPR